MEITGNGGGEEGEARTYIQGRFDYRKTTLKNVLIKDDVDIVRTLNEESRKIFSPMEWNEKHELQQWISNTKQGYLMKEDADKVDQQCGRYGRVSTRQQLRIQLAVTDGRRGP
jgi:hypothetical protein